MNNPIVERRYQIVDSIEETTRDVLFQILPPEAGEDGVYTSVLVVSDGEDSRRYAVGVPGDPWSALESTFRMARAMIVQMHDTYKGQTIFLNGGRTAGWI
jgi:hypothetical protein